MILFDKRILKRGVPAQPFISPNRAGLETGKVITGIFWIISQDSFWGDQNVMKIRRKLGRTQITNKTVYINNNKITP